MKTSIRGLVLIVLILPLLACGGAKLVANGEPIEQQVLVDQARIVVDSFAADPHLDWDWFGKHLKDAKGVLIVPELYKGACLLGGAGGRGVLLVRNQAIGKWVGPAFYTMGSVSLGLQIGGQKSEAVILVMTQKGLQSLYTTSIKIGGELSFAFGPYGAGGQGATAPSLNVDYICYARSMGAFAGLSLDGAVIRENYDWNKAYYGKPVRPVDIIVAHNAVNSNSAKLRAAVDRASLAVQ